jgi:hypothetical protein
MKKHLRVIKNPTESSVIMVTKADITEMKEQYPSISMGNHDVEYLKDFSDDDVVGVVAGDLSSINDINADLWFVNIEYFNEHYTILTGKADGSK